MTLAFMYQKKASPKAAEYRSKFGIRWDTLDNGDRYQIRGKGLVFADIVKKGGQWEAAVHAESLGSSSTNGDRSIFSFNSMGERDVALDKAKAWADKQFASHVKWLTANIKETGIRV